MHYALLPFRAAPLLKPLKQTPRYCSLLKPSVGCGETKGLLKVFANTLKFTSGVPMDAPASRTQQSLHVVQHV